MTRVQVAHSELWAPRRFSRVNRTTLGSLSTEAFKRGTSTGSEPFSLLTRLDATKFVLLSVFTFKETTCPRICSKSRLKSPKPPLPGEKKKRRYSNSPPHADLKTGLTNGRAQIEHRKSGFVIGLTKYHSSFPNLKQKVSLIIYDPVVRTINKLRKSRRIFNIWTFFNMITSTIVYS